VVAVSAVVVGVALCCLRFVEAVSPKGNAAKRQGRSEAEAAEAAERK
jgi:hypothetical protein